MQTIGDILEDEGLERERERRNTQRVEFDTHGMTDECPKSGEVCFEDCQACPHFQGFNAFTVYCSYEECPHIRRHCYGDESMDTCDLNSKICVLVSGDSCETWERECEEPR